MKSHNEFLKDVERESTIPAQIKQALGPESIKDHKMLRETESFSAGDALLGVNE